MSTEHPADDDTVQFETDPKGTFGVSPENRTEVLLDDLRYQMKRLADELERQREHDEKRGTLSDEYR